MVVFLEVWIIDESNLYDINRHKLVPHYRVAFEMLYVRQLLTEKIVQIEEDFHVCV
jgi:hypothetical protein